MRKYLAPFLMFVALFPFLLKAQTTDLKGLVTIKGMDIPVAGVLIHLEEKHLYTVTDGAGKFLFTDLAEGEYMLFASCLGFKSNQIKVRHFKNNKESLTIEMEESLSDLPEVLVQSVSLTGGLRGLKNLPGSGHYLSPKDIDRFNFTDVNQTLRSIPGINLQEEDGFGLRPNIGLRGSGVERSSKITVMEDGVLSAPAPYAAPAAYYFPTIGRIQALEVLKGSSQIRFGPYTTGGAINLISTAIPTEFSGKLNLLGGSFGNKSLHATAGNAHQNFAYLFETFQYQSNGFKSLDNDGSTGFDKKDYLAKFRLNTGPKAKIYQSLTFKAAQTNESSNETYLGLTEKDFHNSPYRRYSASQKDLMTATHRQISIRHLIQFSENFNVTTTLYRNKFHRNWYKLDKVSDANNQVVKISTLLDSPAQFPDHYDIVAGNSSSLDNALFVKANNRNYKSRGIQTNLNFQFDGKTWEHMLDLGIRYHRDEVDRFQWIDEYSLNAGTMFLSNPGVPGTESNRLQNASALASFVQYKLATKKWTFVPGIRYENIKLTREDYGKNDPQRLGNERSFKENKAATLIPGIGINLRYSKHLAFFGGIHKGFSPPGISEDSKPEESINLELGGRYQKGSFSGQAVLFLTDYKNLLGADLAAAGGDGSLDLFNGGQVTSKGLELELTYDMIKLNDAGWTLPVSVTYTYTQATFNNSFDSSFEGWGKVDKGDQLPYLAPHQIAFVLSLNNPKFNINLNGKFQGEMRTISSQGKPLSNEKTDKYFLIDLNVRYQLTPGFALFGSVNNITDKTYIAARRPAGIRPGLPRSAMAGIKANF